MPSPLEVAGAQIQPTSAAPLHTNEFFTGLWTNGNPLGPGAVPFIYQRAAQRYDRFIAGKNVEISTRLTPIRRPGHSVYNPSLFPPINRFYEFRGFTENDEVIRLIADCDGYANQLLNPNFTDGASGWNYGPGWSFTYAGTPAGNANLAMFVGPGTGSLTNQKHINCIPGTAVSASCWGLGEPGATGTANLRLNFYDSSNTLIGASHASPAVLNNYVWTNVMVTTSAPANAVYATVDFTVSGSTSSGPRWFCWGFVGGYYSTESTVREVTQPSTNNILWIKDPAAGRTSFVSDGNILYAGDGVNTHKWITSGQAWMPITGYSTGDFIIGPNGNIQWAVGAQTAKISNIEIDDYLLSDGVTHWRKVTLWFDPTTPLDIKPNVWLTLTGLTTIPALNGDTSQYTPLSQFQAYMYVQSTARPITPFSPETGSATTGNGISGYSAPAFNPTPGAVTIDSGNQWVNLGSAVQPWGGAGPSTAPSVTQTVARSIYPAWAPNTWYSPAPFVIVDSNGNLQQLTGPPLPTIIKTGNSMPTWATTVGSVTTETTAGANAQWTCKGPAAWIASTAYAVGAAVVVTYTYYITVPVTTYQWNGYVNVPVVTLEQQPVTATSLFVCVQAGTSGTNAPAWTNGVGTVTSEPAPSTVVWKNAGNAPLWPASAILSISPKVMDTNNNVEAAQTTAESGATVTWHSGGTGAVTADAGQTWINAGPYGAAGAGTWRWAYSGKNSVTGEISTASPISIPFIPPAGYVPVIQGQGLDNPPWDTIILWRTQAGGSTLLYEDEFPNPGPTKTWIYTDSNPDSALNLQMAAPIAGENGNDPPDSRFIPICYYLGRIWGFVNNQLRWTGGPDTVTGAGNSTMPAKNSFTFPAKGVTLWPTSIGLIVFTTSDMWAVLGQGIGLSPFYAINFQAGIGMASQDAFAVNGSTAYAMITSHQVMSMDPGAGEIEVGFPIGDRFDEDFDPALTYVAWHQGSSKDSAVYVANGDSYWFRMAAVAAPESGNVWSPAAVIAAPGRVKAIASIEISPGHKRLVLGPAADGNPILQRDYATNSDNGVSYDANATIGSVILAQPGGTAGLQFVVTEEKMIETASPVIVKILFDEILFPPAIGMGDFRQLRNITPDPPNLPASKSVRAQRHWAAQDANTVIKCRHFQQDVSWPAEDYPNELFTNTIYGRLPEKARK